MDNISDAVVLWVNCSNDVWRRWFAKREHGADQFHEVESALFGAIVMRSEDGALLQQDLQQLLSRLRVRYHAGLNGPRQVCRTQKAGNIFCRSESIPVSSSE